MVLKSLPAKSGAASSAQRLICVLYSSRFIPPFPTSSMSGSFQCPEPAYLERPAWPNPIWVMLEYLSEISPVVRQVFPPTDAPHRHTASAPYWQRLYTIGRPVFTRASCIFV